MKEEIYNEANKVKTINDFEKFIKYLNSLPLSYDTVCYASAAAAIAGFRVFNGGSSGGITGFQAGFVGWEMVEHFMMIKAPAKIIDYNNMLYPQYEYKFQKVISKETWKHLMSKASENLAINDSAVIEVREHWKSIADGNVPFGYRVSDE